MEKTTKHEVAEGPGRSNLLARVPSFLGRERELAVARLASTLTHTLGTPLQVIAGRAALALKAAERDEQVKHLEIIQRKCSEITALLWGVLDALRPRQERKLKPLELLEFLEELLAELSAVGASRGVHLELRTSLDGAGFGRLNLCEEDLRQALLSVGLNLLAEAPDGALLVVRLDRVEQSMAELTPVHEALLQIEFQRASAPGEQPSGEVLQHISDPWLHAQGQPVSGRALGWSAVYEIARWNEGRVEVTQDRVIVSWPVIA
jgi:two-component system, NtrC family, sensor kinase